LSQLLSKIIHIIKLWKGGAFFMSQNYGGSGGYGSGSGFALIVVLFILLIIVGAAFMYNSY